MLMRKRLLAALLAASLLCGPAALAATPAQQADAGLLRALGLFAGTEAGDDLDRSMTRAEAAVMLVRLFGAADDMPAQTYPTPFADLPDWAAPYVSWLYQRGLTHGTGAQTFSPDAPITRDAYMLFLGRALGYADNATASGKGLFSAADYQAGLGQTVTRGEAVSLTVAALFSTCADGRPFSEVLIAQGVIDAGVFAEQAGGRPTIPAVDQAALQNSTWQIKSDGSGRVKVVRLENDAVCAASDRTFLRAITLAGADGIFGYDETAIYYLDPATLRATRIADLSDFFDSTAAAPYLGALGSFAGTTLFYLCDGGADGVSKAYRFYTWSPAASWQKVADYTGALSALGTLSTVQGKYFSGSFGIFSLGLDGTVEILTRTPCCSMNLLGGILYFIPNDPSETEDGYSYGGRTVRMLAMGKETTVLTLPDAAGYPIRLETVTGATADGVITARGTWHDRAGNEWHVMFSGTGAEVKVMDADNQHSVPDDLSGSYSAAAHMAWWAAALGLETGPAA